MHVEACQLACDGQRVERVGELADVEVAFKGPDDPVTIADRACEAMLGASLRMIDNLPVVGEEAAAADPSLFSGAGGLDPEVTGQIAALTSELVWLGERNMYHKIVRKYKALRKLGAYPDGAGYSAVLKACMDGKIGAVADKVVLDMLASPPEDGLKMADMMTALRACAERERRPPSSADRRGGSGGGLRSLGQPPTGGEASLRFLFW